MANIPTLSRIKVIGDISVEPAVGPVPDSSYRFLIIGPTGAGKSSFIEALAGESQSLTLSKNQLSGYTQRVAAYQVINTQKSSDPVFLIDTPGFSDTQISEIEIIEMIGAWLKENGLRYVDYILFVIPINGTRLPRSIRRTISLVKEFLETPQDDHGSIVFVTSMWDTLHNERVQQRAESNFEQLKGETFKDYIAKDAKIARFLNTRTSALQILDMPNYNGFIFQQNTHIFSSQHLYEDLHQRIEGAIQWRIMIEDDLAQPELTTNPVLKSLLEESYIANEEILTKFVTQFFKFGPSPAGYEDAHQRLESAIASLGFVRPTPAKQEFSPEISHSGPQDAPTQPSIQDRRDPGPILTLSDVSLPPIQDHPIDSEAVEAPQDGAANPVLQRKAVRFLMLKGLFRRLLRGSKLHGGKWFKRKDDKGQENS